MLELMTPEFWIAVGQIILIDILLGGDNAVVIALACRQLPAHQRVKGILWGTAGAIGLRVILIVFALTLLTIPYLKIVGGALLVWIGVKLMVPEPDDAHSNIASSDRLWTAIKTVILADLVMSIDNVMAIAGAAQGAASHHQVPLVIFGLVISVPIIVWGSQLVLKIMDQFPWVITFGAMLLGWIAGHMIWTDPALATVVVQEDVWGISGRHWAGALGAFLVWAAGQMLARRAKNADTSG